MRQRTRQRIPEGRGRGSPTRVIISGFPYPAYAGGRPLLVAWPDRFVWSTSIQGSASWRRDCSPSVASVVGEADSVAAARSVQGLGRACRCRAARWRYGVALARELAALPWHGRVACTWINDDITITEEARRAGARAFVHRADLLSARREARRRIASSQRARYGCAMSPASHSLSRLSGSGCRFGLFGGRSRGCFLCETGALASRPPRLTR
jgi:hypothetical protein